MTEPTADAPLSAYEKPPADGAEVDPRCVPQNLDGPPPIGDEIDPPAYDEESQENWRFLFARQMSMLPGRAGEAYLEGVKTLGMTPDHIPTLRDLSRRMEAAAGWRIARIPGLLHERDFFGLLNDRVFPSTDYIRRKDELDYTPAPDCFHDMFGHMPMLTEPAFADFYHLFGQSALHAEGVDRQSLERLHWFTVEFGLIKQEVGERIFGAGILSSKDEVQHALSDKVEKVPFSIEAVINQDYDVWHLQPKLFVLDSFEQLETDFRAWAASRGLLPADA
ncbi:phenylalanine 4-monooxygenase [Rubrivirga sp. IMCC43871]|uniref:phenylalanine 4-monooxygenase n=1 Tax=Rubrivirga sp. IMCC43871 TaxID=3391575 RepID=UPI00398FA46D